MTEKQAFELLKKYANPNDARIVLFDILESSKSGNNKKSFSLRDMWRVRQAVGKLARGMPVAKITEKKWFYGLQFKTNKYTLDPRPDSETLVDAVLEEKNKNPKNKNIKILDMGTGTGCLVVSIVKNFPGATGIGIDKSCKAIKVARYNVKNMGLDACIKIHKGTFDNPRLRGDNSRFDIIVSNPPYIAKGDARVNAAALHDPKMALFAAADGLAAYYDIANTAKYILAPAGKIFLEIGIGQGLDVRTIFEKAGFEFIESKYDLGGIERVLIFK